MVANLRTGRWETFIREHTDRMTLKQRGIVKVTLNMVLNVLGLQIFTRPEISCAIEARQTLEISQSQ